VGSESLGDAASGTVWATAERRRYSWLVNSWLLLAALLLPTVACTIGPDFTAPVAPLAEKFRGAGNRSVKSGPLEYEHWWTGFRDPTLNKLIQIAYGQNLTLQSAGTRVLQARAVLGIAIGISYPQVQQGVGSIIYNRTSAATPLSPPNATPSYFWTDALAAQAAWTSGASFAAELNPPIACTWPRLRLTTAFWYRSWPMLPQRISVSAQQSS
jgi:hypothetical protein